MAQEKMYALAKKPAQRANPEAEKEVARQAADRDAFLQWDKVENKGKTEGEFKLSFTPTKETSATTVLTPEAVKATSSTLDLRQNLENKFLELLEQNYANCFHHNRLVAKVAEWSMGNIMSRLALLGMSARELAKAKKRIRKRLIEENETSMNQVAYDETMLEIVA